jgi:hypothetical protein
MPQRKIRPRPAQPSTIDFAKAKASLQERRCDELSQAIVTKLDELDEAGIRITSSELEGLIDDLVLPRGPSILESIRSLRKDEVSRWQQRRVGVAVAEALRRAFPPSRKTGRR